MPNVCISAGRLHYLRQLGPMDILGEAKLLENSPHLSLKCVNGVCVRCILGREVIGLVIVAIIISEMWGGCSNAGTCGFLYRTKTGNVAFAQPILLGWRNPNLLGFIPSIFVVMECGEFYDLWLPCLHSLFPYEVSIKKNKNTWKYHQVTEHTCVSSVISSVAHTVYNEGCYKKGELFFSLTIM